jgi:phosphate transport system substrate-binding protein
MRVAAIALSVVLTMLFVGLSDSAEVAQETLRYARSAQVNETFGQEALEAFQRLTGIEVRSLVCSSSVAVQQLDLGLADIASTTRIPLANQRERRYLVTPFCKDPLVVIVNGRCQVDNLTWTQLQDIFAGDILNWIELGGRDGAILRVVPDKDTGAFVNFDRQVMKFKDMVYDVMTYRSVDAILVTEQIPGTISFIARSAVLGRKGIKVLKINGLSPDDPGYPYFQVFYMVTRGMPEGPAKAMLDFIFSPDVRAIMKKRGVTPLERTP